MIFTETESTESGMGQVASYRRLWAATMLQAIRDYGQMIRAEDKTNTNQPHRPIDFNARQLKQWFNATTMGIGDFEWICSLFDLDPGMFRKNVLTNPGVLKGLRTT